jgi:hypothetical protein
MASNPITVSPVIYPTKDLWKALWFAFSANIAANNILVNQTATVNGMTFTVKDVDTGVYGNIKVACTAGALLAEQVYSFPNYVAPGYTATPTQVPYSISDHQGAYQNGYLINV